MKDIPKAAITPVIASSGCLGHVLMSAKCYRAFDRLADAVVAILNQEGQAPENQ